MIKLDVEEYCHNCPLFEPVCVGGVETYYAGEEEKTYIYGDIFVQCENKAECQHAARFVENKK